MDIHYSSKTDNWATPQCFFDRLDEEFNFTLDPCADKYNAKCPIYFTKDDDGLTQSWAGESVFMNPPYGRVIGDWIQKAYEEAYEGALVVALIPARTDTRYWHDYVMQADEIRLVKGRLKFGDGQNSAPFPSAVVIWNGIQKRDTALSVMDNYVKEGDIMTFNMADIVRIDDDGMLGLYEIVGEYTENGGDYDYWITDDGGHKEFGIKREDLILVVRAEVRRDINLGEATATT